MVLVQLTIAYHCIFKKHANNKRLKNLFDNYMISYCNNIFNRIYLLISKSQKSDSRENTPRPIYFISRPSSLTDNDI